MERTLPTKLAASYSKMGTQALIKPVRFDSIQNRKSDYPQLILISPTYSTSQKFSWRVKLFFTAICTIAVLSLQYWTACFQFLVEL